MKGAIMYIELKVEKVVIDEPTKKFLVIMRNEEKGGWFPCIVGPAEAQGIAIVLENIKSPRPLTHDFMKNILDTIKVKTLRAVINDYRGNTFYAYVEIEHNGKRYQIDCRVSDAISLILRTKASLYIDEKIFERMAALDNEF